MNGIVSRWFGALGIAALGVSACSADESKEPKQRLEVNAPIGAGAAAPAGGLTSGSGGSLTSPLPTPGRAGAPAPLTPPRPAVPAAAGAPAPGAPTAQPTAAGAPATPPPVSADCKPADKKPDPMPVPFTQLSGYQRLTKEPTTGPNRPVIETDPGLPEWTIYRPERFDDGPHPILAWAQGGCLKNGTLYGQWLLELASYGYIVLSDGPPTLPTDDPAVGGFHQGAGGTPQLMAIAWLIAENDRPCSLYYHKVTVDKVAVAGQSCGGLNSLAAAADKRITTAVIGNSGGLFSASSLHTPVIYLIGGMNDLAYQQAESDFMKITNVPIFNANMDTGHGGTWNFANGGEFGRVGRRWLDWQLKGDATAKPMFVGPDCELCKPPSMWVVKKKMLD